MIRSGVAVNLPQDSSLSAATLVKVELTLDSMVLIRSKRRLICVIEQNPHSAIITRSLKKTDKLGLLLKGGYKYSCPIFIDHISDGVTILSGKVNETDVISRVQGKPVHGKTHQETAALIRDIIDSFGNCELSLHTWHNFSQIRHKCRFLNDDIFHLTKSSLITKVDLCFAHIILTNNHIEIRSHDEQSTSGRLAFPGIEKSFWLEAIMMAINNKNSQFIKISNKSLKGSDNILHMGWATDLFSQKHLLVLTTQKLLMQSQFSEDVAYLTSTENTSSNMRTLLVHLDVEYSDACLSFNAGDWKTSVRFFSNSEHLLWYHVICRSIQFSIKKTRHCSFPCQLYTSSISEFNQQQSHNLIISCKGYLLEDISNGETYWQYSLSALVSAEETSKNSQIIEFIFRLSPEFQDQKISYKLKFSDFKLIVPTINNFLKYRLSTLTQFK